MCTFARQHRDSSHEFSEPNHEYRKHGQYPLCRGNHFKPAVNRQPGFRRRTHRALSKSFSDHRSREQLRSEAIALKRKTNKQKQQTKTKTENTKQKNKNKLHKNKTNNNKHKTINTEQRKIKANTTTQDTNTTQQQTNTEAKS